MSDTRSFDFNSQAGVMHVLASIRASTVSPAIKNELRDLVFQYSNGGGDPTTRLSLEQKISTYQITPAARPASAKSGRALPFGSARPAPTFKSPANTPVVPTVAPAPIPAPAVAAPIAPAVVVPVAAPVVAPAPIAPAPQSIPVQPIVAPVAASAPTALDRIREIKIAVNKRVGNPVHLVDIDNGVGREYMAALLEAMKQLGGGVAGGIDSAMVRLEAAYQAVDTVVTNYERSKAAATTETVPAPETPVAPVMPQPAPVAPIPTTFTVPTVVAPVAPQIPTPSVAQVPVRSYTPPAAQTTTQVVPNTPHRHVAVSASTSPNTPPTASPYDSVVGYDSVVAQQPPKPAPAPIPPRPSIAHEQAPFTPNDLKATLQTASDAADPLLSPEVDAGLEQLLHDWSLFKKSGLFGTGPKGREHPLFKKLALLQIPLLLTGRFEGATQEIKQSITDYMNGWRFEQGIIYEQNETFEHYLRRVIRKILDLQKRNGPA